MDIKEFNDQQSTEYLGSTPQAAPQAPLDLNSFMQQQSAAYMSAPVPAPPAPAPQEPSVGDYLKVGARQLAESVPAIAAGVVSTVQGQSGVEAPGQGDVFEENVIRPYEKRQSAYEQKIADQFPNSTGIRALSRLSSQVGFSAPSVLGGIAAGAVGAPETGPAAFAIGGAVSGGLSYRADSAQIMRSYVDTLDEEKRATSGQGLTPEETEKAKADFSAKATQHGLWEAIPEAVGGAVAGRLIFGPLEKVVGGKVAQAMLARLGKTGSRVARGIGAAAGVAGEELLTEASSQIGQSTIESQMPGSTEKPLSFARPQDWGTALKQVAPDTLLLIALLGGGAKGGQLLHQRRQQSQLAGKLGIDRKTLVSRIQEVAAYKAANPNAEVSNDEVMQFLAGAVKIGEKPPPTDEEIAGSGVVDTATNEVPPVATGAPEETQPAPDAEASAQESIQPQGVRPEVARVAAKIAYGATEFTPEELQVQQDYPQEVESRRQRLAALQGRDEAVRNNVFESLRKSREAQQRSVTNDLPMRQENTQDAKSLPDVRNDAQGVEEVNPLTAPQDSSKLPDTTNQGGKEMRSQFARPYEEIRPVLEAAVSDKRLEITKPGSLLEGPNLRTADGVYEFTSKRTGGGFLQGTTTSVLKKNGEVVTGDSREAFTILADHLKEPPAPQEASKLPDTSNQGGEGVNQEEERKQWVRERMNQWQRDNAAEYAAIPQTREGFANERSPKYRAYREKFNAEIDRLKAQFDSRVAETPPAQGGQEVPAEQARSASEWANDMDRLRRDKPRPLKKLYGPNPTEAQQTDHAAKMKVWNRAYRKASKEQKIALERDNAAFRAEQKPARETQTSLPRQSDGVESTLPRLKRGYKRETFTIDGPAYEGNVFIEDTSTKGKKTLLVKRKNGVVEEASPWVARRVEGKERVPYDGPAFEESELPADSYAKTAGRKLTDLNGKPTTAPAVYYRGERPEGDRSVSGDALWDSLLFASSKRQGAEMYAGSAGKVSELRPKPEARILYEGTAEFRTLNKGNSWGSSSPKNLLEWASETTKRAKAEGYDAVWFRRQSDVGTAIINRNAFEGTESLTNREAGLTDPIDALTRAIGRDVGQELPAGTFTSAEVPKDLKALVDGIAKLTGTKIVFFKSKNSPVAFNGATNIVPGTLFVNVASTKPHLQIIGHEFLHDLKKADFENYAALRDAVMQIIPEQERMDRWKRLNEKRGREGRKPISLTGVDEEIVADYFGDQFMSKGFWAKLERRDPDTFGSLVQKFLDFLGKIKSALTGQSLKDAETAQEVAAEALERYIRKNPQAAYDLKLSETAPEVSEDLTRSAKGNLSSLPERLRSAKLTSIPAILKVTPEPILVDVYAHKIPALEDFADSRSRRDYQRNSTLDEFGALYDKIVRKGKKAGKLDTVERLAEAASLYQMWPDRTLEEQDWVPQGKTVEARLKAAQTAWEKANMQESTGKSFQEAHRETQKAWESLKDHPELRDDYLMAVDYMQRLRRQERDLLQGIIEEYTQDNPELRAEQLERIDQSFAGLKGAYWPFYRKGDYILRFTDAEGQPGMQTFTSDFERQLAAKDLVAEGVDPESLQFPFRDKQQTDLARIPEGYNAQLGKAIEAAYLEGVDQGNADEVANAKERAQELERDLTQIWLKWQPETSALKNSIRRRNVRGWNPDMMRGFLEYGQTHGAKAADLQEGRKIERILKNIADQIKKAEVAGDPEATRMQMVLNDLREREAAVRKVGVSRPAQVLGQMTTFKYMTSPSIALVQMTQIGVLTLPKLSVMYGPAKAAKALAKGVQGAFSPRFSYKAMTGDEAVNSLFDDMRAVMTPELRQTLGTLDAQLGDPVFSRADIQERIDKLTPYQRQLLALRESMARNLLDISMAHEMGKIIKGADPESVQNKVMNAMMIFMRESEKASRKSTILATFDAAGDTDFFSAMDQVQEVVKSTLYDYSKDAKGVLLQGGTARVLLAFQHFRIMTAFKMGTLFRKSFRGQSPKVRSLARKELVGIFGMSGLLAGVMGMPFAPVIFKILDAVLGDDDEPFDSEYAFNQWMDETLGKTASGVVSEGPASILGAALSRRIGLGDVFGAGSEMPARLHGDGALAWWTTQMLGPAYSMVSGFAKGYDQMFNEGEVLKGLAAASPKPLTDMIKAYGLATEGLKTGLGKTLLSADEIGADEVLMMALGFQPYEVSQVRSREYDRARMSTQISTRRGQLVQDLVKAEMRGEDTFDAREAILRFNKKMPRFGIGASDIRSAYTAAARREAGISTRREMLVEDQMR